MKPPRTVVIGSGFGGLALAIRMQAAGADVTLLEKREKIGGRAYQLVDSGYTFDMGPSLITAPEIIRSVFEAAGRRMEDYLELVSLDPYYRIHFHDGSQIDYVGDAERMKAQMRRFNAGDADRLDAFVDRIRPIYEAVITDRLGAVAFDTIGKMAAFVPKIMQLGAYRPVTSFVNRFFEDPRHRFLYSFHPLFLGGNPFHTPSIYLMIPYLEREGGVWFTPGGMYSLVGAMGRLFEELGGRILTQHEVTAIRVLNGRVQGVECKGMSEWDAPEASSRFFPAEIVASNADVAHTYTRLIAPAHRRRWTDRKVARLDYSMSCFLLYLGVRKTYPQLEHHTLILTERYRELLDDIFRKKVLAEDFSMYVHAPTRTDPGMAPPGCESMYVLVPVPNLLGDTDWTEVRDAFADRIVDFLEAWGLTELREKLEVLHIFTPLDFESELNAFHGNAFAVEPKLTQTAWFRPHNRSEDVEGLYLVGAGTHPGAGVPGVFLSAEATFGCISEDVTLPWTAPRPPPEPLASSPPQAPPRAAEA